MNPSPARRRGLSPEGVASLLAAARGARRHAHAPYSRHRVGAALLAEDGRVFAGANVENASFGLTVCAERVALWSAVAAGARAFRAMAIAGPGGRALTPCGACRQVLNEFSPDLVLWTADAGGRAQHRSLAALLPEAFALRGRRPRSS